MSPSGLKITGLAIPADAKVLLNQGLVCLFRSLNKIFAEKGVAEIPLAEITQIKLQGTDEIVLTVKRPPSLEPGT